MANKNSRQLNEFWFFLICLLLRSSPLAPAARANDNNSRHMRKNQNSFNCLGFLLAIGAHRKYSFLSLTNAHQAGFCVKRRIDIRKGLQNNALICQLNIFTCYPKRLPDVLVFSGRFPEPVCQYRAERPGSVPDRFGTSPDAAQVLVSLDADNMHWPERADQR